MAGFGSQQGRTGFAGQMTTGPQGKSQVTLYPQPDRQLRWFDRWGEVTLNDDRWTDIARHDIPSQHWAELLKMGIGATEDVFDDIEWRLMSNGRVVFDYNQQSGRLWGFLHNPQETYHLIEPQGKRVVLTMQARRTVAVASDVAARIIGQWWPNRPNAG